MGLAQLAVLLRPPTGGGKTRLAAAVGELAASELYQAFVDDTLRLCARIRTAGRVDIALWYAGAVDEQAVGLGAPLEASLHAQPEGDLGARLDAVFAEGLSRYDRVVAIGSDAPSLPLSLIVAAFDSLANASLVLGPASDGGYYAIGASQRQPNLSGVRWSTSETFEDTKQANRGVEVAITSPWYDIDEAHDLALLRAHLTVDPSAAPATAETLAKLAS